MFITQGTVGDTFVVLARTSPEKAQKGITAFVLEKGMKGFSPVGHPRQARHAQLRHGRAPHGGRARSPTRTASARWTTASSTPSPSSTGAASPSARWRWGSGAGRSRRRGPTPRSARPSASPSREFQAIAFVLADMATEMDAARLLVLRVGGAVRRAAALRPGGLHGQAVRQRGGHARHQQGHPDPRRLRLHRDFPVERYFRDAKLCEIGEGTSEIQRLVIARSVLKDA